MAAKPLSASTISDICSNVMEDYFKDVAFGIVTEGYEWPGKWAPLDAEKRAARDAMAEMKRRLIAAAMGKE